VIKEESLGPPLFLLNIDIPPASLSYASPIRISHLDIACYYLTL